MLEYELFNHEDHTECLTFVKTNHILSAGDIIQSGIPSKKQYQVVSKKIITDIHGGVIKCILYVRGDKCYRCGKELLIADIRVNNMPCCSDCYFEIFESDFKSSTNMLFGKVNK